MMKILKNEEDGYQVEITSHERGFCVGIRDIDCGERLPQSKIFPTLEWAESVADAWVNGKEA